MGDTNLAEWGAGQMAGGAFGSVGSDLFGAALGALGVGFPGASDDAIGRLQSQLAMIETQLVGLKAEVDGVMTRVGVSEFDERRGSLDSILDAISEASLYLKGSLSGDLKTTDKANDKAAIEQIITGHLTGQLGVIHSAAAGNDGGIALYNLLVQNLKGAHRFLSSADSTAVKSCINSLQSAQFVQYWLVAQYYRATGVSQTMIDETTGIYQSNILNERQNFQSNRIWEGVVADQGSGLMLYVADCPYVDFKSVDGVLSNMNDQYAGDVQGWRLPTVAELLGNDNTTGVFSGRDGIPGYDGNDGTPAQWLTKHGVPKDLTGVHFWTSIEVPPPDPHDDIYSPYSNVHNYDADRQAWQDAGPPHYCVDSKNLSYFRVDEPGPAHVVAVRNPQAWEREILMPKDLISAVS